MNENTIQAALDLAMQRLDRLDAQLILSHVLLKPRSYLISWPDRVLSVSELILFNQLVDKRAEGYPLAYITGHKSFWDLDLIVTPDVLIPRPDTELLVETALSRLVFGASVLELATGSGAIACALAHTRSDLKITATDISPEALSVARLNVSNYQIEFIESDWFENLVDQEFDMIIANPPYLSETDPHLLESIRYEPRTSLVSGPNGDEDFILIISQAGSFLKPDGWLLLEHGCEQGKRIRELLENHGYQEVMTLKDLEERERVSLGMRVTQ